MYISRLRVDDFRNLHQIDIQPHPRTNLVIGQNASGKSSLLEAIFFLGRGRSFRRSGPFGLIRHNQKALRIVAELIRETHNRQTIGVERNSKSLHIRIDQRNAAGISELAMALPILLITPGGQRLLTEGPTLRRKFIDWGVFHVEHSYHGTWRRYHRALRQRNAALKTDWKMAAAWDPELIETGLSIDLSRKQYLSQWHVTLLEVLDSLRIGSEWDVHYLQGWPNDQSLNSIYKAGLYTDRKHGFTRYGPHRADISIKYAGKPVQQILSNGQIKLLVAAMVIAHAVVYRRHFNEGCVLLLDDLPSELDRANRESLYQALVKSGSQLFATAIEQPDIDSSAWGESSVFHVEHGAVKQVL